MPENRVCGSSEEFVLERCLVGNLHDSGVFPGANILFDILVKSLGERRGMKSGHAFRAGATHLFGMPNSNWSALETTHNLGRPLRDFPMRAKIHLCMEPRTGCSTGATSSTSHLGTPAWPPLFVFNFF